MKILQVAERTYPALGGVELHTSIISKKLVERGHEVTLVVFNSLDQYDCGFGITYQKPFLITKSRKPSLPEEECWNGVRILRFSSKAQLFSYYWSPEMLKWLIKNIGSFDLVHTHCFRFSNNEFVTLARFIDRHDIPLIFTCHDAPCLNYMGTMPLMVDAIYRKTFGKTFIQSVTRLIATSKRNAEEYVKYLFANQEKIRIVPNGVDLDNYKNLPDPVFLRDKLGAEQVILYIGRFIDYKNPDKLILAMREIVKRFPNSCLLMIGKDYGLLDSCKILASGLDKHVMFFEDATEKTKLEALALADLCVIPSSYESFGIVVLEAQASGVPIIVDKNGISSSLIANNVIGSTDLSTADKIAESVIYLLEQPDIRKKMGIEGKKFAGCFSWDNTIAKLERVYREVLEIEKG